MSKRDRLLVLFKHFDLFTGVNGCLSLKLDHGPTFYEFIDFSYYKKHGQAHDYHRPLEIDRHVLEYISIYNRNIQCGNGESCANDHCPKEHLILPVLHAPDWFAEVFALDGEQQNQKR